MTRYVLINRTSDEYAAEDCQGQHDGKFTPDVAFAQIFQSFGEVSDFSQNFDDSWQPAEI